MMMNRIAMAAGLFFVFSSGVMSCRFSETSTSTTSEDEKSRFFVNATLDQALVQLRISPRQLPPLRGGAWTLLPVKADEKKAEITRNASKESLRIASPPTVVVHLVSYTDSVKCVAESVPVSLEPIRASSSRGAPDPASVGRGSCVDFGAACSAAGGEVVAGSPLSPPECRCEGEDRRQKSRDFLTTTDLNLKKCSKPLIQTEKPTDIKKDIDLKAVCERIRGKVSDPSCQCYNGSEVELKELSNPEKVVGCFMKKENQPAMDALLALRTLCVANPANSDQGDGCITAEGKFVSYLSDSGPLKRTDVMTEDLKTKKDSASLQALKEACSENIGHGAFEERGTACLCDPYNTGSQDVLSVNISYYHAGTAEPLGLDEFISQCLAPQDSMATLEKECANHLGDETVEAFELSCVCDPKRQGKADDLVRVFYRKADASGTVKSMDEFRKECQLP